MSALPRVIVMSLGGTISSARAENSGLAAPRLRAAELVAAVPELAALADIEMLDVAQLPSNDLSFVLARRLAREIAEAEREGVDGVVITQGTDTIEEMSFCLDLTVPADIPVVVTGAMRHSSLQGADGPANLLDAVRVAIEPNARGLGTLVTLNEEIHSARAVRKGHTASPAAFWSPDVGPIGWLAEGRAHLRDRPYPRVVLPVADEAEVRPVPLITSAFDDDGWWLPAASAAPGLVIEGLGGGHVPGWIFDDLVELASRIPVLLTSRTGHGTVLRSTYGGFRGSETMLVEAGVIMAGTLDGLKARVLLSLLLASGADRATIVRTTDRVGQLQRTVRD
jgi:L-asparaginase/archaeal Glu-tRNAGln amidotransferase subunit D